MPPKALLLVLGLLLPLSAAACGGDDDSQSVADGVDDVVRQLLQTGSSDTAPGQSLELSRVIVPAGEAIAPHTHPGTQLAVVVEGTLTYTVIDGEVQVIREAGGEDGQPEPVASGQTVDLEAGDSIVEPAGMVHQARNDGDEAVVLYLSSLFPEGAPASSPAE